MCSLYYYIYYKIYHHLRVFRIFLCQNSSLWRDFVAIVRIKCHLVCAARKQYQYSEQYLKDDDPFFPTSSSRIYATRAKMAYFSSYFLCRSNAFFVFSFLFRVLGSCDRERGSEKELARSRDKIGTGIKWNECGRVRWSSHASRTLLLHALMHGRAASSHLISEPYLWKFMHDTLLFSNFNFTLSTVLLVSVCVPFIFCYWATTICMSKHYR